MWGIYYEEIYKRITEAEIVYNSSKADLDAARKRLLFIQNKLAQERKDLVPTIEIPFPNKSERKTIIAKLKKLTQELKVKKEEFKKEIESKEKEIEKFMGTIV